MKKWHWLLLSLFSVLILAACNPGDGSNENDSKGDGDAAKGEAELTFWSYVNPNQHDGQLLMDMVDEFNELHEDIEIKYEYIPHGEIDQQVSVAVAGGGLPDILMIDNPDHARYASMNVLEDITDKVQEWGEGEHYFEGPWASTIYEEKNYGVPFTTNALALFVNNDRLAEKGISEVPTTWDELYEVSAQLTEGNTFGFAMSAISGPEGMFQFLPFLLSTGANYDQLDDPNAYRAMEFVTKMVDDGYMSRETLNWGQGEVASQFTAGNAAMMVNGPWMLPQVRNDAPDMDFSIALIPKDSEYASVLGGENLALPKGENVEEAWTFLSWLSSKEQAMRFSEGSGQFSPRVDVSEELGWEDDPHPAWNEIAEAIQNQVHNSITGISTPEEATEKAHQDVLEIIE